MNCEQGCQGKSFMDFWERMASRYPMPFDEKALENTQQVLSFVRSKGLEFHGATVLDIGCGTGIYTLPIAREAAMVVGLDSSEKMIARMNEVILSEGIENVRSMTAAWKDADIQANGFEKAFDIAWVSMSPAVKTPEDFERMERCARRWCVYIGWGRKRKNALMEEIYSLHGIEYGPPPGAQAAYDMLAGSGKNPSLDYFETSWEWTGSVEEAMEDAVSFLEMQGEKAQRGVIEQVLARYEQGGVVHQITEVEEGIIVWPV